MTLLGRNFLVSTTLALSDFISFIISIYLAMAMISITANQYEYTINIAQSEGWIALHWLLAFCCVGWYAMRLRHYFYRKTFWFELKEILRTLVIFAVIEIAVIAFTTWSYSRSLDADMGICYDPCSCFSYGD
jgi:undecaprenyl-phosphate galactose phosphotransferase